MPKEPSNNKLSNDSIQDSSSTASKLFEFKLPRYPLVDFYIFLSFLAFVVVRYIQLGARRDILATIRFEFIVGFIVIILTIFQISKRKPILGNSRSLILCISLLFFSMVMQLPMAASPDLAQQIFLDRVIKFALLTFFMIVMIESPRYLKFFIIAFLFSVFYITSEAVRGLISGSLVWQNQGVMRLHGAVPIYKHPNSLGGVALGALPFIIFWFPLVKKWIFKICLLFFATTSIICIIYSGSRTAYVGLISLILWWWFQSPNKMRFFVSGIVVGSIFLMIVPGEYIERFQSIGGKEKEGHSSEKRIEILEDAIVIFSEHPFGIGVASFPSVRLQRFGRSQDTHNLYLEVGTNLGVQGLIVFLALMFFMLTQLRRSALNFEYQMFLLTKSIQTVDIYPKDRIVIYKHIKDLQYLTAMAKATGGFILTRLVLGFFGMDLYEVYWWFATGMAIVLAGLVVTTNRITKVCIKYNCHPRNK